MDDSWALEKEILEKRFGKRDDDAEHEEPHHHGRRRHPTVQTPAFCTRAVDRLKRGPANVPDLVCKGETYTDADFTGADMIYWTDYNTYG